VVHKKTTWSVKKTWYVKKIGDRKTAPFGISVPNSSPPRTSAMTSTAMPSLDRAGDGAYDVLDLVAGMRRRIESPFI
jgi:hypothetical protein